MAIKLIPLIMISILTMREEFKEDEEPNYELIKIFILGLIWIELW